jgi:hypothetical protein
MEETEILVSNHVPADAIIPFQATWSLYVPPGLTFKKLCILSTRYLRVFCMDLRTVSDYFPIQHELVGFWARLQYCEKRL